ncbi:Cell cycle checkpoint protein RAD17 [Camellia lanceoleosa]|uniref:Cell cycle checkpoint protein RAD17 n=1 Tax=Camellia lanceoleosa TaxID=1840588 RepID=A0ACC0IWM9_9ERIC|nr:Cell cycle checkpoint protein RAD17 [Camellia lanceoleosa]
MGKRNAIVVSSSDDDDDKNLSLDSNLSHSKPKSRASSVPRASSRRSKKTRLSDSYAISSRESNGFDEIKLFCEDFDDGFSGFKMSTGSARSNGKDLWVDKYKPRSLEELAVHKKKVEEVKLWFEEKLRKQKEEFCNNVLLITGQAGVGKSATVHVIASHLGATVCEWETPIPTIWQEHLHNSNSGMHYTSKLDEFENFVERIRKYGLIPSSFNGGSRTSNILLIDDLPVANGKVAYERLNRCLHLLVQSALIPTIILITECGKDDSSDHSPRNWEELQLSLQRAGACKVAFNPITVNSIKKTLSRLCREEHCNVDTEQVDLIARASGGDIRHAITSLQYFCVKPHLRHSLTFSSGTPTYLKERSDEINRLDDGFSLPFGRDETLSLFHALGKFLHNKRETESSISLDHNAFLLKERFARLPLKMDAPEKVLCKSHGQARPVADFLHENVLDFLSEEAIDDAWVVTSYLSDADFLLASLSGMRSRNYEAENIVQSSAASVSVRGVLFGNFHPSPSRWHAIRRPSLWQVEQSLRHNKLDMVSQRCVAYDGLSLSDLSVVATEFKPVLKWLGFRESEGREAQLGSTKDNMLNDDSFDDMSLDDEVNETTDDEIEDW